MHLSFGSLAITTSQGLQTFLMDFHHNTSLIFILEDDSISLTSKAHIHSYSGKGAMLWLVVKSYFRWFHIAHFTFISTLCFCLGLIQPSTSTLFMCECGHELIASGMHLACYLFKGQQTATHDTI
jgi:hypothetical protein